jgi:Kef-type K+ transport system membrane component KefB
MSDFELSVLFFLQLAVILAVVRLVGLGARKIGQPQVVGEMIAGVVLGPSLLGLVAPGVQQWLFPQESLTIIYVVAQVGVVIYMFLVGTEFQLGLIRGRMRSAASVSAAGIVAPFILGGMVASFLVGDATFFNPNVSKLEAMLFLGAAISITAFPMLARIIYERGLTGTSLGTLALAAGAVDDVSAWCLLAVVLASFSGNAAIALVAIGGGIFYALLVLVTGKRLLARFGEVAERRGALSGPMLSFVLILVMAGAWFTDYIGIYAVFGGFIMGLAMPRGVVTRDLERFLEPVATNFLLPLFFVYSGFNTQLGLVVTPELWGRYLADHRGGDPGQGRGLLGRSAAERRAQPGSHGYRRSDERAWADGTNPAEHRLTTWYHHTHIVHHHGHHGRCHNPDGYANLRTCLSTAFRAAHWALSEGRTGRGNRS